MFERIFYFGDTARVPYGTKDKNTIIRYSLDALEFFKNFNIDILIAACNSVSAHALSEMRENAYCDIVGVIEPGVWALKKQISDPTARILVTGTKATISSGRYRTLLEEAGFTNIEEKATGLLVPLVEEGIFKGPVLKTTLHHYFKDVEIPEAVILGCTHFPLIANQISGYFGGVPHIHSGDAIVDYLRETHGLLSQNLQTDVVYLASENPAGLKRVAKEWLSI